MSWTRRFFLGVLIALALMAIETDWFGLLPGASGNVIASGCVLALVALYAIKVSVVGAAVSLFAALCTLYLDQATVGLGVGPLPFTPPPDFWASTVLRAAGAWAASALLLGGAARPLPAWGKGIAVVGSLLFLPFLRYDQWGAVIAAYADPFGQHGVMLTAPWLPVVFVAALVVTMAMLIPPPFNGVAAVAIASVALGVPAVGLAYDQVRLATGLAITPAMAGPLDQVMVRTKLGDDRQAVALWDGHEISSVSEMLSRPITVGGLTSFLFYPGAQPQLAPGVHEVALAAGSDIRRAPITLSASGDNPRITLEADSHVAIRGTPNAPVLLMVSDGRGTSQLIRISLDSAGTWHSALPLPPGRFRLIAQEGTRWSSLDTAVGP
jgi:hypothetical protein